MASLLPTLPMPMGTNRKANCVRDSRLEHCKLFICAVSTLYPVVAEAVACKSGSEDSM